MSKIHFTDTGKGFPIILLHGFGESSELWKFFQGHLSDQYRVIAPDLPGFGQSPLPKENLSLSEVADTLHSWLQSLQIQECIMIGHSLGGYITLAFAQKYPDLLKGFGLFHSSAYADTDEKKENRKKTIAFIKKNGTSAFMETFIPALFYEENRSRLKPIVDQQIAIGKSTSVETLCTYLAAMASRPDHTALIQKYDKPVLMIIGENDSAVPFDKSQEQANLLKQPHIHILEKTGHMGMFEHERETLKYVKTFVEKVSRA